MNELPRKPLPHMTAEEFLAWPGDGTGRKFQLFDGEVRAMAPAVATHGIIQANLAFLLVSSVRSAGSRLTVITEGTVIPGLRPSLNVRVADLVVTAAQDERGRLVVAEPLLMIKVLSTSNQGDTRRNVRAYMSVLSVPEIVVIHSVRVRAEVFRRDAAGGWPEVPEMVEAGAGSRLASVGLDCPIAEVYAGTWVLDSSEG